MRGRQLTPAVDFSYCEHVGIRLECSDNTANDAVCDSRGCTRSGTRNRDSVNYSLHRETTNLDWKNLISRVQVPWSDFVRSETSHLGGRGEGVPVTFDVDIRGLKEL